MTTMVRICDRWEMPLIEGKGGHYRYLDTASQRNAACFLELCNHMEVPAIHSVVEYFGGVGIFSTIIQQLFQPFEHHAFDLDPDCVAQLKTLPGIQAAVGDAHETMGSIPADLIVCDLPVSTLRSIDEWPWVHVAIHKPRYIVVSDTALRRLGLHRALYSKFAGSTVHSFEDYVKVYSEYMWKHYGYSITHVAHHVYSYFLLEPRAPETPTMVKVAR